MNNAQGYDIGTWLAAVGGISKSVLAVFAVVTHIFSYRIFVSTVLENLFLVKKNVGVHLEQDINEEESIDKFDG